MSLVSVPLLLSIQQIRWIAWYLDGRRCSADPQRTHQPNNLSNLSFPDVGHGHMLWERACSLPCWRHNTVTMLLVLFCATIMIYFTYFHLNLCHADGIALPSYHFFIGITYHLIWSIGKCLYVSMLCLFYHRSTSYIIAILRIIITC